MTRNLYLFLAGILATTSVDAAQVVALNPLEDVVIQVSENDLNRVMVEGDRIVDVFVVGDALDLVPDERLGHIYIRPTQSMKDTKMTITTEGGKSQDLTIKSKHMPGQTIYLADRGSRLDHLKPTKLTPKKIQQTPEELVTAFRHFLQGDVPKSFKAIDEKEPGMTARFKDRNLEIQYWRFKNKTPNPMHIKEKDFRNHESIQVVFIERKVLNPGEDTLIVKGLFHG